MDDWFRNSPLVYELNYNSRRGRSMRDDPDYQRVAARMEAERIAALPVVIGPKDRAKAKRRAKNRAARKARRKAMRK